MAFELRAKPTEILSGRRAEPVWAARCQVQAHTPQAGRRWRHKARSQSAGLKRENAGDVYRLVGKQLSRKPAWGFDLPGTCTPPAEPRVPRLPQIKIQESRGRSQPPPLLIGPDSVSSFSLPTPPPSSIFRCCAPQTERRLRGCAGSDDTRLGSAHRAVAGGFDAFGGFCIRYLPVTSSFPSSTPSLPNSVHQPSHHPPQAPHPARGRSRPPGMGGRHHPGSPPVPQSTMEKPHAHCV